MGSLAQCIFAAAPYIDHLFITVDFKRSPGVFIVELDAGCHIDNITKHHIRNQIPVTWALVWIDDRLLEKNIIAIPWTPRH